ncbi:MAG: hypothetical protein EON60_08380, partial [Alphaproteobacteria bacterium]
MSQGLSLACAICAVSPEFPRYPEGSSVALSFVAHVKFSSFCGMYMCSFSKLLTHHSHVSNAQQFRHKFHPNANKFIVNMSHHHIGTARVFTMPTSPRKQLVRNIRVVNNKEITHVMPAYVITVATQKGGSGKSTLAAHLAVSFAQQGYSTMLFDTDPQGTITHWHAQRKSNDIGLIATSGWRLTRDLSMAREANDIIIIDTPPHAEMDIKVSVRAADMVIIPIQPSPTDVWAVKETFNTISSESRQCMVVLNRVVQRANITVETKQKLKQLDIPVAEQEIGNRVLFAASMESGLTVLDGFA